MVHTIRLISFNYSAFLREYCHYTLLLLLFSSMLLYLLYLFSI